MPNGEQLAAMGLTHRNFTGVFAAAGVAGAMGGGV